VQFRWGGYGGALIAALAGCGSSTAGRAAATTPGAVGPRVLVLDLDGFHAGDLDRFVADHPDSTLASLAKAGVRYTDVTTARPSDSFPGVLALFTGGSPASTGLYYDLSYDRTLSPPGSDCSTRGTTVNYTEQIDIKSKKPDGGGGLQTALLPRDPANGCGEVPPHAYLRVNTAFEVVKARLGRRTAWMDKHLSYEILQGPSGAGIDDLWNPEIAASGVEKSLPAIEAYDDAKVSALLDEIRGLDHTGTTPAEIPALFGMNFQAVSVEQKIAGYVDAAGTPTGDLEAAMEHTDASIGQIVAALRQAGLWSSTVLVLAAPHGQAPVDRTTVALVATSVVPAIVEGVAPGLAAQVTGDDVGLVWLTDQSKTDAVKAALEANAATAGAATILAGPDLAAMFPDPAADARTPDLVIVTRPGVIYSDSPKLAEHGGFSDDDTKVALLVVGAGGPALIADPVETRQVAPSILQLLGIDPGELAAVRSEGTAPLPGLAYPR